MNTKSLSSLRQRMIEDMTIRGFGEKTKADYVRHVERFVTFLARCPKTATPRCPALALL